VPPLRRRPEDLAELAELFLRQQRKDGNLRAAGFSEAARRALMQHSWPGNVRELQNVVERAVIVSHGGKLELELPESRSEPRAQKRPAHKTPTSTGAVIPEQEWRSRERSNVLAALRQASGRISGKGGAADLLGINPATLTSRIKSLGIDKADYK